MARHALALTHLLRAEPSEAAEVARLSADLAAALDFPFWHGLAEMELGAALAQLGDERGLPTMREAMERLTAIGNVGGSPVGMALLGEAYQATHCYTDVLDTVEIGLTVSVLLGQPFCDAELLARRAARSSRAGRDDEAVDAFEQSIDVGRAQGAASSERCGQLSPTRRRSLATRRSRPFPAPGHSSRRWATASTPSTSGLARAPLEQFVVRSS